MATLLSVSVTCWLATFIVAPRRPLPGNDVAERIYARLLGRQQRLVLLAIVLTGAALLALAADHPRRIDPDLQSLRDARASCAYPIAGGPICRILEPGGTWAYAEFHADGSWRVVPSPTEPGIAVNPLDDPKTPLR